MRSILKRILPKPGRDIAILAALELLLERTKKMLAEIADLKVAADALKAASDRSEARMDELKAKVDELAASAGLSAEDKAVVAEIKALLEAEAGELNAAADRDTP